MYQVSIVNNHKVPSVEEDMASRDGLAPFGIGMLRTAIKGAGGETAVATVESGNSIHYLQLKAMKIII